VARRTAKDRRRRALKAISEWCRKYRHRSLQEQWYALNQKLRGHLAYYGIRGNFADVSAFRSGQSRYVILSLSHRERAG
jgi:RNA-directed DNA polymerase